MPTSPPFLRTPDVLRKIIPRYMANDRNGAYAEDLTRLVTEATLFLNRIPIEPAGYHPSSRSQPQPEPQN